MTSTPPVNHQPWCPDFEKHQPDVFCPECSRALPNLYPGVSKPLIGARLRVILNGIGVQSMAMVLMAEEGLIGPKPDFALTSDPGDENSGALENLAFLRSANLKLSIPTEVVKGGDLKVDFDAAIAGTVKRFPNPPFFIRKPDGKRGQLVRSCTRDYKIRPSNREIKRRLGLGRNDRLPREPIVEQWLGITVDEAHRMAPSNQPHIYNRYPLVEIGWTREQCDDWIFERYGFRAWPSACIRCPFRDDVEWLSLQQNFPADFEEACRADDAARRSLPNVEHEAFIHDSLQPLRSIDFKALVEAQQGSMFSRRDGICGGYC